jgi:hypothetical protein
MNRAMLAYIPPNQPLCSGPQVTRLEHYQTLITALHSHLAGYMQTQPLASYNNMFQNVQDDFARLGRAVMPDHIQIRDVAYELCVTILSMIAIYGRPPRREADFVPEEDNGYTPGRLIISDLLNTQWSIQRLIGRIIYHDDRIDNADWLLEILRSFPPYYRHLIIVGESGVG